MSCSQRFLRWICAVLCLSAFFYAFSRLSPEQLNGIQSFIIQSSATIGLGIKKESPSRSFEPKNISTGEKMTSTGKGIQASIATKDALSTVTATTNATKVVSKKVQAAPGWKSIFKSHFGAKVNSSKAAVKMLKSIISNATSQLLGSSVANPPPNLSKQKAPQEAKFLKLHMCNEGFEAYAGSWFTTKQHMINTDSFKYNLTWVNCEMASFIHMEKVTNPGKLENPAAVEGLIMQSLDVLDFSVIHLSVSFLPRIHSIAALSLYTIDI